MPEQLVVLIGSDGKHATVTRSIATQASLVLRDLLDGREPKTTLLDGVTSDNSNRMETPLGDEMNNTQSDTNSTSTQAIELPFPYFTGDLLQRICAHMTYRFSPRPSGRCSRRTITGNNNISCTGAVTGSVGRNVMRPIPRPMVLPLNEYLDHYDRRFIEKWDEATTVLMVKAATLLNYEELLNLASAKLAAYLSEKSVEGIRAFLGVESDFTPEEEAELKKEHEEFNGN